LYLDICLENYFCWAGGVSQMIECLPSKHEALVQNPILPINK
jgi:hypothetical protein